MDSTYRALVLAAAQKLELLDTTGDLARLDSVAVVDMVSELETSTELRIPISELQADNFRSVDAIVKMLTAVATGA
jgi:acyl carrier protein